MKWDDGKQRCHWANPKNEVYLRYHDEQWGNPVHNDELLFEMLLLESFQAGLSWECILNKYDAFKKAFDNFDVRAISQYDADKVEVLAQDAGIVRNRRKILAAIKNATVFQTIQDEWGSFDTYLWHWTNHQVIIEYGPTQSELSDAISKDLKKRGMTFVGSIIIYAYLQAVGVINGHEPDCFCSETTNT